MFDKIYELSLTKDYVSSWGLVQAVRELIQNQLDSGSPFVYAFEADESNDSADSFILRLRSEFSRLEARTLLLGSTSKRDDKDSIGSFGEGYKIAMLVLTRLGHTLRILNGDKLWTPFFKYNRTFEGELLAVRESSLPSKHSGLTFEISGLSMDEVEAVKLSCLKMQSEIGEVIETSYGEILPDKPGQLYVGSLFVCDTNMNHGYNIKPEFISLERDRQTVSSWDLASVTKQMWVESKQFERIARMAEESYADVEYIKYSSNDLVREACYQHFKRKHPGKVAASNQKELDLLVQSGMREVIMVSETYHSQVVAAPSYNTDFPLIRKPLPTPHEVLSEYLRNNKQYMQRHAIVATKELIEKAISWKA